MHISLSHHFSSLTLTTISHHPSLHLWPPTISASTAMHQDMTWHKITQPGQSQCAGMLHGDNVKERDHNTLKTGQPWQGGDREHSKGCRKGNSRVYKIRPPFFHLISFFLTISNYHRSPSPRTWKTHAVLGSSTLPAIPPLPFHLLNTKNELSGAFFIVRNAPNSEPSPMAGSVWCLRPFTGPCSPAPQHIHSNTKILPLWAQFSCLGPFPPLLQHTLAIQYENVPTRAHFHIWHPAQLSPAPNMENALMSPS